MPTVRGSDHGDKHRVKMSHWDQINPQRNKTTGYGCWQPILPRCVTISLAFTGSLPASLQATGLVTPPGPRARFGLAAAEAAQVAQALPKRGTHDPQSGDQ